MPEKLLVSLKARFAKLWGYFVWLLVIILVVSTTRNIGNVKRVESDVQAERGRLAKIEKDNEDLKNQIAQAQSPDFIETEIRNKLGLAKSGEAIVVLPDAAILRQLTPQPSQEADVLPDPNWKKWLKLFF